MGYTIDIIDMADNGHTVNLEYAERSSIRLKWHGSDAKDEKNILGSSLFFSLEAHISNNKDANFSHLFTGDETRYKVRFYDTDTEVDIWTGFLLPESYDEPYTANTFYVSLEATDGLGRLKGKYFEDSFYTDKEISVPQIYADCLAMTGLELPLYISPAIKNSERDRYDDIYLPGNIFLESDKKMSVYAILEKLAHDMLCQVRQVENVWEIIGFNQQHKTSVTFDVYDYDGTFTQRIDKNRLIKSFRPLGVPTVSIVPPYKNVTVTNQRVTQVLPETIAEESNDGWTIGQGVEVSIMPTHWYGNGGYYPEVVVPGYKVVFPVAASDSFDDTKYASLIRKIYVQQYQNLVFKMKLSSDVSARLDSGETTLNGFKIAFKVNGDTLYEVTKSFDDDSLVLEFDLYISDTGLMDIEVFQPYFDGTIQDETLPSYLTMEEMTLKFVDQNEEEEYEDSIDENYSIDSSVELTIADDSAGYSNAFRLRELNLNSGQYNEIDVQVMYTRQYMGVHYVIVPLFDANLIADNLDSVYLDGVLLNDVQVHYNLFGTEEMAVEVPHDIDSGNLTVRRHRKLDVEEDRKYWQTWSDTVFPVETDRYGESVAKVLRRMSMVPYEKVDFVSESAYKINDIVLFDYVLANNYFLTSLEWNVDTGESVGTMVKCVYEGMSTGVGGENLSPIVNAGEDVVVPSLPITGVQLEAVAYDLDGFISTVAWELVEGSGVVITNGNTLSPTIYPQTDIVNGQLVFLTTYPLKFKVTVTDDDGATANDYVVVKKSDGYQVVLTDLLNERQQPASGEAFGYTKTQLEFSPIFQEDLVVTVKGDFTLEILHIPPGAAYTITCLFEVYKNGHKIIQNVISENRAVKKLEGDFEFGFMRGDAVIFEITAFAVLHGLVNQLMDFRSEYEITRVQVQQGAGVFTGYPVGRSAHYDYPAWET